jgi:hypothetical protein
MWKIGFLLSCAISLAVVSAAQTETTGNSVGVPKPTVKPTAGTWKYKETDVIPAGTYHSTFAITIQDDGDVWTVGYRGEFPDGPVTDVSALEKGTLLLRKELFKHFAKPGRPWVPVAIDLDFTGNKVTGAIKKSGQDEPFALNLGGPVFAGGAGAYITIGCLPLADGYSTTFRNFDIEAQMETPVQLKVVGMERVTVPAGTFDSWKVELTSANSRSSHKGTAWIAKESRTPVKTSELEVFRGGTDVTTTELVP